MFTILIPVLKEGYLKSQLKWLSNQTYKNFSVVVMDSFYKKNKYFNWANKKYPFNFYHLPLLHNIRQTKRYDFSIKNNLALLSPTPNFVMVSDTHYFDRNFCQEVSNELIRYGSDLTFFQANTLLYSSFSSVSDWVDLGGETTHISKPAILFSAKSFFYVLNGYDEVSTYSHRYENMYLRAAKYIKNDPKRIKRNLVYHILHPMDANDMGVLLETPCERCSDIFCDWRFDEEREFFKFNSGNLDVDSFENFLEYDIDLGVDVFRCPNCGFCGTISSTKLDHNKVSFGDVAAPTFGFGGDVGRGNLSDIYSNLNSKVGSDIQQRFSYIKKTY